MSLEVKSQELKELISTYDTPWFLGFLSQLINDIASGIANEELGNLSSPLRQLYFLGGLLITSKTERGYDIMFDPDKWGKIIDLLNDIEYEYDKLFFPNPNDEIDDEWKKIRKVAIPSFLTYFNQGPLNFEEQSINWVRDLFSPLDTIITKEIGLITEDFIQFYNNLDNLVNNNLQSYSRKYHLLRPDWDKYTRIKMGVAEEVPDFIKEIGEKDRPLYTFMADYGIINRFYPPELTSDTLSLEKVESILHLLTTKRKESDFQYYTSTKPGNPLYDRPIIDIGEDMFQVFEVKQVIHAIENILENICLSNNNKDKLVKKKGDLLEDNIVDLFEKFLKKDYEVFRGYYVDGCEQDILFLWKEYAFIIEAKGYSIREPFRDPDKAFIRIKDDFKACIGYGYNQTSRVEQKFISQEPLLIKDKNGNLIKEIDTTKYTDNDFSIIVNLKSFGQIQNDLEVLLEVKNGSYPWVVKFDDLEVFILTLIKQKKSPDFLIEYLLMREKLHGKLICSDELQICGGYIIGEITEDIVEKSDGIVTSPDLARIFDDQYNKGMGFKNEKFLYEKTSGKYLII